MQKTTQEKIDYIYDHIRKEEKRLFWRRFTKFLMYLFFIVYLAYFYLYGFEKLKNSIIEAVKINVNSEEVVEGLKEKYKNIKNNLYKNKKAENEKITPELSY